jgi:hypothetical protein
MKNRKPSQVELSGLIHSDHHGGRKKVSFASITPEKNEKISHRVANVHLKFDIEPFDSPDINYVLPHSALTAIFRNISCSACETRDCSLLLGDTIGIALKSSCYKCNKCGFVSKKLMPIEPKMNDVPRQKEKLEDYYLNRLFNLAVLLSGGGGSEAKLLGSILNHTNFKSSEESF